MRDDDRNSSLTCCLHDSTVSIETRGASPCATQVTTPLVAPSRRWQVLALEVKTNGVALCVDGTLVGELPVSFAAASPIRSVPGGA